MDTVVMNSKDKMDAVVTLRQLNSPDAMESPPCPQLPDNHGNTENNTVGPEMNDSLEEIYINHLDENMHNCGAVTVATVKGNHGDSGVDVVKTVDDTTRTCRPGIPTSHSYTSLEEVQARFEYERSRIPVLTSLRSVAMSTPNVSRLSDDDDPNQYTVHHSKRKRERCGSLSTDRQKDFQTSSNGHSERRHSDRASHGNGGQGKLSKQCSADSLETHHSTRSSYHDNCIPGGHRKVEKPNVQRRQTISGRFRSQQMCQPKRFSVSNDGSDNFVRRTSLPCHDWVVCEQDLSKLTNAQKRRVAMAQFSQSRYKYGLSTSTEKPPKNFEKPPSGRKSPPKKEIQGNEDKRANGTCVKTDDVNSQLPKFIYEMTSSCSVYGPPAEKYQTPLQQKEKQNKELQQQIKELQIIIQKREDEIYRLIEERQQQTDEEFREREQAINEIQDEHDKEIEELKMKHSTEILEMQKEIKKMIEDRDSEIHRRVQADTKIAEKDELIEELEYTILQLRKEYNEREECHRNQYLATYKKGQLIQEIETEEEVVHEAAKNPQHKTVKKLLKKLDKTEQQLEKLQAYRRQETYENGPHVNGDCEAVLELLRSAIYYYLIDREPIANLKAIMSVMDYTDVQRRAIIDGIKKKKK